MGIDKKGAFNIELLITKKDKLKDMKPVSVMDIMISSTKNFHPDGLFSTEIFGMVGTEYRNRMFSYIDLRSTVFHPIIFRILLELKQLYGGILSGKKYAVWDAELKDFVQSNALEGDTGFAFFVEHFKDIEFTLTGSQKREVKIDFLELNKKEAMYDSLLVYPAGLRDYSYGDDGAPSEDEVNKLYRRVLGLSGLISQDIYKLDPLAINSTRYNLQLAVLEVYQYFEDLIEGKNKFILGKFVSRKTFNTTRNVITSMVTTADSVDDPRFVGYNETALGLLQTLRSTEPKSIFSLRDRYLSKIFEGPNAPATLVNSKTLRKETVMVDPKYYDSWMSPEGLEKTILRFANVELRHKELTIGKHYMALLYLDNDNNFKFIQGIEELKSGLSKDFVRPISFAELLYISIYDYHKKIPAFFTRYPVIEAGSVYPAYIHLRTTNDSEVRYELDDNWERLPVPAAHFPKREAEFFDTMSVSASHLAPLGGDHDGDQLSEQPLLMDDSIEEIKNKLNDPGYYVDAMGGLLYSSAVDYVEQFIQSTTA